MTHYSYSRVSTFEQCPKRFEYRYVKGIEVEEYPDEDDPLLLGKCMDTGLEHGFQAALEYYDEVFPYHSQKREWELFKLKYWIERLGPHFKDGTFQIELRNDWFIGYADWYRDGHLVDFKYASPKSVDRYRDSAQLHLYHDIMTKHGYDVKTMTYVIIPKLYIRQKKTESTKMFYDRMKAELDKLDPIQVHVEFNSDYLHRFGKSIEDITMANVNDDFPARPSKLCSYCPYRNICESFGDENH